MNPESFDELEFDPEETEVHQLRIPERDVLSDVRAFLIGIALGVVLGIFLMLPAH